MKRVTKSNVIYSYSIRHKPAECVKTGEPLTLMTEDAFGGQIRNVEDRLKDLTGPKWTAQRDQCMWTLLSQAIHLKSKFWT
jgi:acetamidase/formamidase